jgi:gliding motility-associated-like protein
VSVTPSSTSICSGGSITFTANPTNGGTPTYQWKINGVNVAGQTSATFTTTSLANGDAVTVVMTSNDACANPTTATSTAINIPVSPLVPGIRYSTVTTIANVPTPLQARTIGANYSYQWVPPSGLDFSNVDNPVFNYDKKTEYIITLTSAAGCVTVDTLLVDISSLGNGPYVFVPNVWTPNGDGHNDYLFPFMLNITKLKYFRIYNRWGQKVFETNIPGEGWNGMLTGKPQVMDVYTWTIEAIGTDGSTYKRIGKAALLR